LVLRILKLLTEFEPLADICFYWDAIHQGASGSELADRKANETAGWREQVASAAVFPRP
jgi:hypothetical protein